MTLHRHFLIGALALCLAPGTAQAQATREPTTLTIAYPRNPARPVPTLWSGDNANREVSDLIFLRLADLGPEVQTVGDKGFVPRLARSWERRDKLTLVFELDPRARWQDGTAVTSADVVFGFDRARNPRYAPNTAAVLSRIQSVIAEGDARVVVKFTQPYSEQLYDAVHHALPLPAHLLSKIPPDSLAGSSFMANPVGNGPYRWVRRVPDQLVELAADTTFFLGKPEVRRILFLNAPSPEARMNLLLSSGADASDNIYSFPNPERVENLPSFQYYPVPGVDMIYVSFNYRDPADTSRPHPILADKAMRQALVLATNRALIARASYGPLVRSPGAPVSAILGRSLDVPPPPPYDTLAAMKLLESRGWTDHDGDKVRDKGGKPLRLRFNVPTQSNARVVMATRMQEALRSLGIQLELNVVDGQIWSERRDAGKFDLDFAGATQDPAPSGLVQSWSCSGIGGANKSHYCDPQVDKLIARAVSAEKNGPDLWRDVLRQIAGDYPAIFMAALTNTYIVNRRFQNVTLRPGSPWANVWQWKVAPN